jgi:hypothetical protein
MRCHFRNTVPREVNVRRRSVEESIHFGKALTNEVVAQRGEEASVGG